MPRHRMVIVGAGRIGAAYNWPDDSYSHAGAALALKDRVELLGFVEPDPGRRESAGRKWGLPSFKTVDDADADIVSVCVQPEQQKAAMESLPPFIQCAWVEKPWVSGEWNACPVNVNYLRRADLDHQYLATRGPWKRLVVYGKDDETTRCHFRDLSRWWNVPLDYRTFNGPCAYALDSIFFDNGGINPGDCMKAMLGNLLDAVEGKAELFSPPYVESA